VLAASLLFGFYALLPDEFSNLGLHMAAASAFAANLAFWRESGYFAPAAEFEPLLHRWSFPDRGAVLSRLAAGAASPLFINTDLGEQLTRAGLPPGPAVGIPKHPCYVYNAKG
jgi:hypothetical protein